VEHDETPVELIIEPEQMAGVWANSFDVVQSDHEFTLDFARLDFRERPPARGILVARIALSPLLAMRLLDSLQAEWSAYAAKAMPKEVRGNNESTES
jgi:uncharacterized protein DUF3467